MKEAKTMNNPYTELIEGQWPHISALYNEFAEQRPVILMDVDNAELHAYPFDQIADALDERSRSALEEQYQRAQETRQMVLILRDKENRQTMTYTLKLEDE